MILERCCYWYKQVSRNYSDCHVSYNGTAVLTCEVYAPRDSSNNSLATVKWYRNNESVIENVTDRYENSKTSTKNEFNSSNTSMNGLFEDRYQLIIRNVNSSDSGVYWCQLSADGFCFIPSAYLNITVNTSLNGSESNCLNVNYMRSPVCALSNPSSCQVIPTSSVHIMSSTPSILNMIMSSTPLSTSPVNTPSATPTQLELCHGKPNLNKLGFVACLGVTVPAAGFTLILMIILICCAGICICWRKKTRRKGESRLMDSERHCKASL